MRRRRQSSRRERDRPRALNARSRAVPSRARASRRASSRRVERVECVAIVSTYVHHFLNPTRASKRRHAASRARHLSRPGWTFAEPWRLVNFQRRRARHTTTRRGGASDRPERRATRAKSRRRRRRRRRARASTRVRTRDNAHEAWRSTTNCDDRKGRPYTGVTYAGSRDIRRRFA